MIITRTPFRVSLFGSSTDYTSYYSKYGALLIGFTIDKYIYTSLKKNEKIFNFKSRATYSEIDSVQDNKNIRNPGIRGVLEYLGIDDALSIAVQSDLPKQTGLGSSSALVVGLLKAIDIYLNHIETYSKRDLANLSIKIEREFLNEPGGLQDQVWSSFGGANSITIDRSGYFIVRPLHVSEEFLTSLKDRMVLCYIGSERQSFDIAASHDDESNISIKRQMHNIAKWGLIAFESENINEIGTLLHRSWMLKKNLSDKVSNDFINDIFEKGLDSGAIGGKLLGAGGSGFMLFILKNGIDRAKFAQALNLEHVDFDYSYKGSEVLLK